MNLALRFHTFPVARTSFQVRSIESNSATLATSAGLSEIDLRRVAIATCLITSVAKEPDGLDAIAAVVSLPLQHQESSRSCGNSQARECMSLAC